MPDGFATPPAAFAGARDAVSHLLVAGFRRGDE
jgi:hypothetical protein